MRNKFLAIPIVVGLLAIGALLVTHTNCSGPGFTVIGKPKPAPNPTTVNLSSISRRICEQILSCDSTVGSVESCESTYNSMVGLPGAFGYNRFDTLKSLQGSVPDGKILLNEDQFAGCISGFKDSYCSLNPEEKKTEFYRSLLLSNLSGCQNLIKDLPENSQKISAGKSLMKLRTVKLQNSKTFLLANTFSKGSEFNLGEIAAPLLSYDLPGVINGYDLSNEGALLSYSAPPEYKNSLRWYGLDGTLISEQQKSLGTSEQGFALADMNGDGLTDLAYAAPEKQGLYIMLNKGQGPLNSTQTEFVSLATSKDNSRYVVKNCSERGSICVMAPESGDIWVFSKSNMSSPVKMPLPKGTISFSASQQLAFLLSDSIILENSPNSAVSINSSNKSVESISTLSLESSKELIAVKYLWDKSLRLILQSAEGTLQKTIYFPMDIESLAFLGESPRGTVSLLVSVQNSTSLFKVTLKEEDFH